LRTQQILAYESGVAQTIDPLGGSFAIEALTDEIEARARSYLDKIDELGGALAALERGFQQGEIEEAAFQTQMKIQAGGQVVVGVNAFASDEKTSVAPQAIDPALETRQRQRLEALRSRREASKVAELLGQVEATARGSGPLMPLFIDCVEKEITLGEICEALRQAWGEYHPS
jgi:methylmalonyl-CoA mutase N-terminal domain/subunit